MCVRGSRCVFLKRLWLLPWFPLLFRNRFLEIRQGLSAECPDVKELCHTWMSHFTHELLLTATPEHAAALDLLFPKYVRVRVIMRQCRVRARMEGRRQFGGGVRQIQEFLGTQWREVRVEAGVVVGKRERGWESWGRGEGGRGSGRGGGNREQQEAKQRRR